MGEGGGRSGSATFLLSALMLGVGVAIIVGVVLSFVFA